MDSDYLWWDLKILTPSFLSLSLSQAISAPWMILVSSEIHNHRITAQSTNHSTLLLLKMFHLYIVFFIYHSIYSTLLQCLVYMAWPWLGSRLVKRHPLPHLCSTEWISQEKHLHCSLCIKCLPHLFTLLISVHPLDFSWKSPSQKSHTSGKSPPGRHLLLPHLK